MRLWTWRLSFSLYSTYILQDIFPFPFKTHKKNVIHALKKFEIEDNACCARVTLSRKVIRMPKCPKDVTWMEHQNVDKKRSLTIRLTSIKYWKTHNITKIQEAIGAIPFLAISFEKWQSFPIMEIGGGTNSQKLKLFTCCFLGKRPSLGTLVLLVLLNYFARGSCNH